MWSLISATTSLKKLEMHVALLFSSSSHCLARMAQLTHLDVFAAKRWRVDSQRMFKLSNLTYLRFLGAYVWCLRHHACCTLSRICDRAYTGLTHLSLLLAKPMSEGNACTAETGHWQSQQHYVPPMFTQSLQMKRHQHGLLSIPQQYSMVHTLLPCFCCLSMF